MTEKSACAPVGIFVTVLVCAFLCSRCNTPENSAGPPVPAKVPSTTQVQPTTPESVKPAFIPPPDLPATPAAQIASNRVAGSNSSRKQTWLTEQFRCRAISTVKLRRCRFEETSDGYRLKFQKGDVVCQDVEFDENGDPNRLTGCRSGWLKVPANNQLRSNAEKTIWSGSHRGWRWKGDGDKYCCPGMWLEAPESLR